MTSTPSEELLSCPFCGGEPYVIEDDRYNRCHVGCDCVAGPRIWQDVGFLSDAIAAWNRRSTSSAERAMREALEKISAEQWKDRSTVSELNAWPAFQRLNSHVVELYAIADAALTSKEEK